MPEVILTDQAANFCSSLMKNICTLLKIKHIRTTAYHPQSNGSLERFHRDLKTYLLQFTSEREWDQLLQVATFAYNTTVNSATGHTPFYLMFGRAARIPSSFFQPPAKQFYSYDDYVSTLRQNLRSAIQIAKENLNFGKEKSKLSHDKNLNTKNFKVDDLVFLKVENPKKSLKNPIGERYDGPFKIIEKLSEQNYKIVKVNQRTRQDSLEKIVHATKLKPYKF
jgi:hypothetical protein